MPKNCKNCGIEMPEEAHFCLSCLTETEEKAIITTNNKAIFFTNKRAITLIATAILIIILIIICTLYFANKNNTPSNLSSNTETNKTMTSTTENSVNTENNTKFINTDSTTIESDEGNTENSENSAQPIKNTSTKTSDSNNQNNIWSNWTTDKPDPKTYFDLETRVEYRYRTKSTVTSYSTSLSGYTQNGYTLINDSSGTIDYVDEFPTGFDKSNVFYTEYNKSPKITSDTSTQKTTVSTEIVGYLYWHWAYPLSGPHSEDDRPVSDTYNEQIGNYGKGTIFEAFQTDVPLNWNSQKLAFQCTGHSTYSYWWTAVRYDSSEQLPVKRCKWTTQNKLYNYYKISEWSEWSTDKPENFYDMETRTLYRYK